LVASKHAVFCEKHQSFALDGTEETDTVVVVPSLPLWIRCSFPHQAQLHPEKPYEEGAGRFVPFACVPLHGCLPRHSKELELKIRLPREAPRTAVAGQADSASFGLLATVLGSLKSAPAFLNIGETGNSVHPEKGRQKKPGVHC
jgi:hypothetical protein